MRIAWGQAGCLLLFSLYVASTRWPAAGAVGAGMLGFLMLTSWDRLGRNG